MMKPVLHQILHGGSVCGGPQHDQRILLKVEKNFLTEAHSNQISNLEYEFRKIL